MKFFLLNIIIYMFIYGHVNLGNSRIFQFQILLGIFSSIYFFITVILRKKIKILKIGILILIISSFIPILYIISCKVNIQNTVSNPLLEYSIRNLLNFITAYTIIKIFNIKKYEIILNVIVNLVTIELIIGIIRFLSIDFSNFINLIYFPNDSAFRYHSIHQERLVGFGAYFFNGGILNSLALICSVYFIKMKQNIKTYTFLYFFILIFGILMARTTIIGFIMSMLYYLQEKELKEKLKLCVISFIGILGLSVTSLFFLENIDSKILRWGFEIFSGKSESVSHLLKMYKFPLNIRTYLIGDGLWILSDGKYYMETDVGYLRILWCIGIFGIILFLFYQKIIFSLISKYSRNKEIERMSLILFLMVLVLNLKGYVDLYKVNYLFLSIGITYEIRKRKENGKDKCINACL